MTPRISVVIPARNDGAALGETLAVLDCLAGREAAEVLVCAAGNPAGIEGAVGGRAHLLWPAGSTRAAVALAEHPDAEGGTFHLVVTDPPTQALATITARLRLRGLTLVDGRSGLPQGARAGSPLHCHASRAGQDAAQAEPGR